MDFGWSDEQQEIRRLARDFAEREVAPHVADYDRDERFPAELVRRAGELGLAGGIVPTEYGGAGLDWRMTYAALLEEVSADMPLGCLRAQLPERACRQLAAPVRHRGPEAPLSEPLAKAETFAGAGVTEARSGTDVSDMDTTARRDGSDYVISGAKMWISFLNAASFFLTFAHLGVDERTGRKRICAFIVDKDLPGVLRPSAEEQVRLPPARDGRALYSTPRRARPGRRARRGRGPGVRDRDERAVESGGARRRRPCRRAVPGLLRRVRRVARERRVFRQPIGKFQLVQGMISEMVCGTESARLLTYRLAYLKDKGERARDAASMAKMTASDVCAALGNRCVPDPQRLRRVRRVPGRARYLRDAKVFQIKVEGGQRTAPLAGRRGASRDAMTLEPLYALIVQPPSTTSEVPVM